MRSRTAIWFEAKIRYEKMMEDGILRKVTETYVVDALSFGEAEKRAIEEITPFVNDGLEIADLKIAQYKEVFFADNQQADRWYVAKLAFITIDEKTDKEKKTRVCYLVNAGNINAAIKNIEEVMAGTMIDYDTLNVSETQTLDVFEYKPKGENKPEKGDN